jgi:hypothetical protein
LMFPLEADETSHPPFFFRRIRWGPDTRFHGREWFGFWQ